MIEEFFMKRQITRTLFDILADITIVQCSEKKIEQIVDKYDAPKNLMGMYEYKTNTIYLRKSLNHEEKLRTLFHEMAHAYSRNIMLVEGQGDLSEDQVENMAAKWHQDLYGIHDNR